MSHSSGREKTIFLQALEIVAEADRAAYLDRACGKDRELRTMVEALLVAHHRRQPLLDMTADEPLSPLGTQIGPYKLLQQIGEGGMGVVYMAEQKQPVERRVALKIIKPGMDSGQVIARFEAERQALAMMDHPNISKVLDAGTTESGRPYFVMELVKGQPITQYCDEHHLTPRQRLELLLPVCQAIQHAHQKGIIHRDIKPTNILVAEYDQEPVPKVIDFGVAKAIGSPLTDKTMFTGFGQIVGTLEYMSPEQAKVNQLDIDTRSDIYSLGVLLYELLTGSTPFDKQRLRSAALDEMLRIIREEEPPKPSTRLSESKDSLPSISAQRQTEPARLTRLVRGELDWIVMKALEKDRNRRYETAGGFATDLQRYLADEPVQACPPSAMYRLSKFARRNKGAIAFAAVVTILLLVALGGIIGGIGWAMRDRAAVRQQIAMDDERRALKFRTEISTALDDAEKSFQQDRLPQATEAVRRAEGLLASAGGDDELSRRVGQWRADLAMVVRLEDIRLARAAENKEEVDWAGADQGYRQAFKEYGLDVETLPPAEAIKRLRTSPISGRLVAALDDWFVTERHARVAGWEEMLSLVQQVDTDGWRNRFREAFRTQQLTTLEALARDEKLLTQPPATVYLLSLVLEESGKQSLAIEILLAAQKRHPGDFWINFNLGNLLASYNTTPIQAADGVGYLRVALGQRPESPMVHLVIGFALWRQNKPAEAEAAFRSALKLKSDYARAHLNLGVVLGEQGKSEEGIAEYREAIRLAPDYGKAHMNFAYALEKKGELDEAEAEIREAVRCLPRDPAAHMRFARFLQKRNKPEAVQECLRNYLRLVPDDLAAARMQADVCDRLGWSLQQQKKLPEAARAYQEAKVSLQNALRGKPLDAADNKMLVGVNFHLGSSLKEQSRWAEAIAAFDDHYRLKPDSLPSELVKILANCPVPEHRNPRRAVELARKFVELTSRSPWSLQLLGWSEYRAGHWQASIEALEESCKLQRNNQGDPFQWYFIAMAHWQLGHQEEARKWYHRSVRWMESYNLTSEEALAFHAEAAGVLGISLPSEELWAALRTAQEHFQAGEWTEAEEAYRRALALEPSTAAAHQRLGEVLEKQNRQKEAEAAFREAIRLAPDEFAFLQFLSLRLTRQRRWTEAEPLCREMVRLQPDNPMTHQFLGDSLNAQRRFAEAEAAYREAIKLAPNSATHYYAFGNALRGQGKEEEAKTAFREAIRLEPDRLSSYYALNDPAEWEKLVDRSAKATQAAPSDAAAWARHGSALVESRRWQEAVDVLNRAIELEPQGSSNLWQLRGRAFVGLKEWERAVSDFDRVIELNPQDLASFQNRGIAYRELKQFDKAIADGTRQIELQPNMAYAWAQRGWAYLDAQQWQAAVDDFTHALELDPKGAPYWWLLRGRANAGLKQWESAVDDLTKAAESSPWDPNVWGHRGGCYSALNKLDEALADYSKAIELNSRIPWLWADRGDVHAKRQDWDRAIADYTRSVELDANTPWISSRFIRNCAQLKRYDQAAAAANKALSATPVPKNAWFETPQLVIAAAEWPEIFERLVKLRPKDPRPWTARIEFLGNRGQWQEAAELLPGLLKVDAADHWTWYSASVLHLQNGNADGHRRACDEMLKRYSDTTDPYIADRTAKTLLLVPGAVADVQVPRKLTLLAAAGDPSIKWFHLGSGLAEYRAGNFEAAIECLKKSISSPAGQLYLDESALVVQAMAEHRLGRAADARQTLKRADELIAERVPKLEQGPLVGWQDWIRLDLLRREAEGVIGPEKVSSKPTGTE
jgi:tetratricopeptide (TPR) repeat protein/serine/threonine protein kinase